MNPPPCRLVGFSSPKQDDSPDIKAIIAPTAHEAMTGTFWNLLVANVFLAAGTALLAAGALRLLVETKSQKAFEEIVKSTVATQHGVTKAHLASTVSTAVEKSEQSIENWLSNFIADTHRSLHLDRLQTDDLLNQLPEILADEGKLSNADLDDIILPLIISRLTGQKKDVLDLPNSYYRQFGSIFKKLLAAPYRDSVHSTVKITECSDDEFLVEERSVYACKAGVDGKIQDKIIFDLPIVKSSTARMTMCKVMAELPILSNPTGGTQQKIFDFQETMKLSDLPASDDSVRTILTLRDSETMPDHLEKFDEQGQPTDHPLRMKPIFFSNEFKYLDSCDGLRIVKETSYIVGKGRSLRWHLLHPAEEVVLNITAPDNTYEIVCRYFTDRENIARNEIPTSHWEFHSTQWLSPYDGFVYRAVKIP